jgi:hypothetical protein
VFTTRAVADEIGPLTADPTLETHHLDESVVYCHYRSQRGVLQVYVSSGRFEFDEVPGELEIIEHANCRDIKSRGGAMAAWCRGQSILFSVLLQRPDGQLWEADELRAIALRLLRGL